MEKVYLVNGTDEIKATTIQLALVFWNMKDSNYKRNCFSVIENISFDGTIESIPNLDSCDTVERLKSKERKRCK